MRTHGRRSRLKDLAWDNPWAVSAGAERSPAPQPEQPGLPGHRGLGQGSEQPPDRAEAAGPPALWQGTDQAPLGFNSVTVVLSLRAHVHLWGAPEMLPLQTSPAQPAPALPHALPPVPSRTQGWKGLWRHV